MLFLIGCAFSPTILAIVWTGWRAARRDPLDHAENVHQLRDYLPPSHKP